ncbi:MAG: hypothetical protein RR253_01790 [Oscillospiraceae bacterium]
MKKFYIVLSRSGTILARAIRIFTKKYYNHTSISFERSLNTFYSFGRRNPRLMFPAGFITEGVHSGFFALHPKTKICVLEGEMSEEAFCGVQKKLEPFIREPKKYKYGILQMLKMMTGKPYRSQDHYVCSVFAAYLLDDYFDFGKDYSLVYPEDFYIFDFKKIYEGTTGEYEYEKQ